jgi:N-acetylneuraminate lyase
MATVSDMVHIQGVIPALVTPFRADGDVDVPALERLIPKLYEAGAHGLYVCGQTGEGLVQSVAMRKAALEAAVRYSPPGKAVIAHVGAARMEDALELARHALQAGASAVSSLPPAGFLTFDEIRSYYATLAASTELPLLVYYFPEAAPNVKGDQIGELCALPNVSGIKFTSFELQRLAGLVRSGSVVLSGRDEVFAAGLLMGAHGGIGSFYNLVPELFCDVYAAAQRGAWSEARRVQDRINSLISITLGYPMISAIKKMLEWSGLPCGAALPPKRDLTQAEETSLRQELEGAGFNPSGFLATRAGVLA